MTLRQRFGAVVCFFKGCALRFDSDWQGDSIRHRWYCDRCGWEEYTLTAQAAWAEMTRDWGAR